MRHPALTLLCLPALASEAPNPPHVAIPRLPQAPSMAWDADLSTWTGALRITEFGLFIPNDKGENPWPTVVHAGWGPDALYLAVEALDPDPSKIHAARHMRDTNQGDFDLVGVDLDPSGTGRSTLRFWVSPLGGQMDSIVTDSAGENLAYNCLWDATGVLTPTGYVVKLRIPYSSLRRTPGEWALRVLRLVPRNRRFGITWPRMSRDIQCDLCQMARISGAPVEKPGSPFLLIPFATFNRTQSLGADPGAPAKSQSRLGLDLRYATTALTFEGTYRPDFATADADVNPLQINSRFKVLYPEQRPFFLEGMELLSIQGAQRQFFSRSIQNPLYGVKASGQSSFASWTLLHAEDSDGGQLLGVLGAVGVEGLPTRDTAAAVKLGTDDKGSGLSFLGTDKALMGGPDRTGGQSGGLYVDQYLGSEFHVAASALSGTSHLPRADGTLTSARGNATSAQVDWTTRNWTAMFLTQATSPDLTLLSGFADLQGYRRQGAGFTWRDNWNRGRLATASITARWRRLTWWNGDPMDRAYGLDAAIETPGRLLFSLSWDTAGRTWAEDRAHSVATRALTLGGSLRRFSAVRLAWSATQARTLDLASGDPARFRSASLSLYGTVSALSYNLTAKQSGLDREDNDLRLIRARQLTASGSWQFPRAFYVKAQAFVVRYDGSEADGVDKFLKAFVGWQPNAFTNAYVGWSGQRRRSPFAVIPSERMVERGIFAKLAYALQF
ncbi:MAG: hypothetical protein H6P99_673 [Holophagaceae bacterium]|nr:hypothetical protein [Holophagaceae bacterium]